MLPGFLAPKTASVLSPECTVCRKKLPKVRSYASSNFTLPQAPNGWLKMLSPTKPPHKPAQLALRATLDVCTENLFMVFAPNMPPTVVPLEVPKLDPKILLP